MQADLNINDYEIIPHSKLKHMHSFINDITYRNFHFHSDFELMLVLKGNGQVKIQDKKYVLGELDSLIVNKDEIHSIEGNTKPFILLMIQFSRHFCGEYFPVLRNTTFNTRTLRDVFKPDEYKEFIKKILSFNLCFIKEEPAFSLSCIECLSSILHMIYSHARYTVVNESQYQEGKKTIERVSRISKYIGSNYLNPIRLKDLADMEGITETHMSHVFTKNFGITFQEYLTSKRMEEAVRLSRTENFSNTMISELCGFSDPKYLNKAFEKHFGCNYKEFIKKNFIPEREEKEHDKDVFERFLTRDECLKIHSSLDGLA